MPQRAAAVALALVDWSDFGDRKPPAPQLGPRCRDPRPRASPMEKDWSEGVPRWAMAASWAFWLTVLAVAAGLFLQVLAGHRAEAAAGARDWNLRVEMCQRLSKAPRPPWWECHTRAAEDGDLLAPRTPDDQLKY